MNLTYLSIILLILISGCLTSPWGTSEPSNTGTVSPANLGPLPKELYVEMVFNGITENAEIKVWSKGDKQRTNIVRTDKEGKKWTAPLIVDR